MREKTLVLALVLTGCGAVVPYGSFVTDREPIQAAIAVDAAKELAALFLAEGQAVCFGHDARDAFGRSLASALRKEGFAIRSTPGAGDLVIRYVLDAVEGTELLRVVIYVRGRTLARAYAQRAGGLYPVGPWSHGSPHGS